MLGSKKLKTLFEWKEISEEFIKNSNENVEHLIKGFPENAKIQIGAFTPVKFDQQLTLIGLEVEVENITVPIKSHWWEGKADPSLRNHGCELFSVFPYRNHKQVSFALGEMDHLLKKAIKDHDFSWRTCIQVHADMTRFNIVDLCNFLLFYCSLEPLLFKIFSEQRRNSIYCVPLFESDFFTDKGDTTHLAGLFAHAQKNEDVNWASLITKIWPDKMSKYSAINFSRLSDLCTVEFRHLAGTDDMKKVTDWISVILLLLKKAKNNISLEDSIKEINNLKTKISYHDYLVSIFGNKADLLIFPHFDNYLNEGVRKCKELVSLINKEVKAMTKIAPKGAIVSHFKIVKEKREARIKRTFS